jgi:ATP-dependent Lon protease
LNELKLENFKLGLDASGLEKLPTISPRDVRKILLNGLGFVVPAKRDMLRQEDS